MHFRLIACILCLTFAGTANGQINSFIDPDVESQITSHGHAHVIVSLLPVTGEAAKISDKMKEVALSLDEDGKRSVQRIGKLFLYTATVNRDAFARLRAISGIKVYHDRPVPPALSQTRKMLGSPAPTANRADVVSVGQALSGNAAKGRHAVAVIDTGLSEAHPFVQSNVLREACFSTSTSLTYKVKTLCPNGNSVQTAGTAASNCPPNIKSCNHGLHVAGIISGVDGGNDHLYGISESTPLIVIQAYTIFENPLQCPHQKFIAPCIGSFLSDQLRALEYVRFLSLEHPIAAVNFSLGEPKGCDAYALNEIIPELRDLGIVTVVAAGNDGSDRSVWAPACLPRSVAVGALDKDGKVAVKFPAEGGTSSSGQIAFWAPGVNVISSIAGSAYGPLTGTSMAAPHISAAIARLRDAIWTHRNGGAFVSQDRALNVADSELALALLRKSGKQVKDPRNGVTAPLPAIDVALGDLRTQVTAMTGIATPAGSEQPATPLPMPGGSRFILVNDRPLTRQEDQQFREYLQYQVGSNNVAISTELDKRRVIVDTNTPVDQFAIQQWTSGIGLRARVYEDSIAGIR